MSGTVGLNDLVADASRAAADVARLDEAMRHSGVVRQVLAWGARQEAVEIARAEGKPTDERRLARLRHDDPSLVPELADHMASDAMDAMEAAASMDLDRIGTADVVDLWAVSDRYNKRRVTDASTVTTERDASAVASVLAVLAPSRDPGPMEAAEVLRRLVADGGFLGTQVRMPFMLCALIVRTAFRSPRVRVGIARQLGQDVAATVSVAADDPDRFASMFFRAVSASCARTTEAMAAYVHLVSKLDGLTGPRRRDTSLDRAIQEVTTNPYTDTPTLTDALGMSRRGGALLMEKLLETGILTRHGDAGRGRVYVCERALGIRP